MRNGMMWYSVWWCGAWWRNVVHGGVVLWRLVFSCKVCCSVNQCGMVWTAVLLC